MHVNTPGVSVKSNMQIVRQIKLIELNSKHYHNITICRCPSPGLGRTEGNRSKSHWRNESVRDIVVNSLTHCKK